ncbi:melanophilin-like isoform X2 [Sphaeramia orbicularis]|uniref:melanophilin-like isoform X2 n=1 Tax=Sphaeramia orbicularis TaxID=375764 RepID=UPI0011808F26|nr:melanophilin isoform X2 [Sphaeramia orbicularis]
MPGTTTGKKLDLSKLTDEEAKHVWGVIQRDFDLRKKEEDRLGDLKTKIEKEDTKRELLGNQTSLTETYCIRCLQPFKFLVNNRRQCLDCNLYICKSCSRYNKKEHGWVCDPCRMARVLKIGTLEWYHENVRARFKRFGSAKVMRSLFKRLSGEDTSSQNELGEPSEYDTQSIPEVQTDGYGEHSMDPADSQNYKGMKKTKRRLTVDPFDLDLGDLGDLGDYLIESGGRSNQAPSPNEITPTDVAKRESMLAEADMASVFHNIFEEQRKGLGFSTDAGLDFSHGMGMGIIQEQDDFAYTDSRALPSRSMSRLSYSSCGSGSAGGPQGSGSYLAGPDDSEEDFPLYQSHQGFCSHTSQESLNSTNPPPQITDLNRRVSAIESLLNRLERRVSTTEQWEDADLEEQQLRQKLDKMTDDISDHSVTSDEEEEESNGPFSSQDPLTWRSPLQGDSHVSKIPTKPTSKTGTVVCTPEERQLQQTNFQKVTHVTESPEWKLHPLEEESKMNFRGSTALLVELEDKVAQAAADVQNTESEVSYIEDRIAALNAAGMPVDKRRRSAIPIQARRLSHNFPTSQVDRFVRNSLYRGSLTQRNPVAKPKPRATCAKPVMTQGS